jgi:hypothetical protein
MHYMYYFLWDKSSLIQNSKRKTDAGPRYPEKEEHTEED